MSQRVKSALSWPRLPVGAGDPLDVAPSAWCVSVVTNVPIDAPRAIACRLRSCAASGDPPGSDAVGVAQPLANIAAPGSLSTGRVRSPFA